mmetsp:Transcript_16789/g.24902  ORF Transcript_16789/g.24902 Transcript_16789/m.24902 type:complete len:204 (-) Transcript_16789:92-703(-)
MHTRLDKPFETTKVMQPVNLLRTLSDSFRRNKRRRSHSQTLHLVPIAGILDWNDYGDESISQIVMACYDADSRSFQTVCRVDVMNCNTNCMAEALEELCDYMRPSRDASCVDVTDEQTAMCDVWFDPVQVWEVEVSDFKNHLKQSDEYSAAALKNGSSGIGIGIGVVNEECSSSSVKFVRLCCDLNVEDATSSDFVLEVFSTK